MRWQPRGRAGGATVGKWRSSSLTAAIARTHAASILSLEAPPALTAEASWWKVDVLTHGSLSPQSQNGYPCCFTCLTPCCIYLPLLAAATAPESVR